MPETPMCSYPGGSRNAIGRLGISRQGESCDVLRTHLIQPLGVRSQVGTASGPSHSLHAQHCERSWMMCYQSI